MSEHTHKNTHSNNVFIACCTREEDDLPRQPAPAVLPSAAGHTSSVHVLVAEPVDKPAAEHIHLVPEEAFVVPLAVHSDEHRPFDPVLVAQLVDRPAVHSSAAEHIPFVPEYSSDEVLVAPPPGQVQAVWLVGQCSS